MNVLFFRFFQCIRTSSHIFDFLSPRHQLVIKCSWLFWYYFVTHASDAVFKRFKFLLRTKQSLAELFVDFSDQHRISFYFFLLHHLRHHSQKNQTQIFALSFFCSWRGLSMRGLDVVGALGITMKRKTFERYRKSAITDLRDRVIRHIHDDVHVAWVDNFSKTYKAPFWRIAAQPFRECLWAGYAISLVPHPISTKMGDYNHVPSLPDKLFTPIRRRRLLDDIHLNRDLFQRNNFCMYGYYQVDEDNIFVVPMKNESLVQIDPHTRLLLPNSRDGLQYFKPAKLLRHNPASNQGLANIIAELGSIYMSQDERYSFYKMDYNLYWRWMKVDFFLFLNIVYVRPFSLHFLPTQPTNQFTELLRLDFCFPLHVILL